MTNIVVMPRLLYGTPVTACTVSENYSGRQTMFTRFQAELFVWSAIRVINVIIILVIIILVIVINIINAH